MKKPRMLLKGDILKPVILADNILRDIMKELVSTRSQVIQRSLFTYAMASFEIMLTDLISIHLEIFPEKIENKEFKILKEDLINSTTTLTIIEKEIEKYVQDLSYKNVMDYLKIACSILSIVEFDEKTINEIQERKATRNLLIHNNLKYNNAYHERSGKLRRDKAYNGYLPLTKQYIEDTINLLEQINSEILTLLSAKYEDYTKYNALKNLWKYIFNSPILKFEDYWEDSDLGITFKMEIREFNKYIKTCYSGTETAFLALWISHFNSSLANKTFNFNNLNTFSFDDKSREKYLYLLSVIENYPEIFKTP